MKYTLHRGGAEARSKAFNIGHAVALPEMAGFSLLRTSFSLRLCASAVQVFSA
ncbi:MAG: hypothetical protein PHU46_10230 [Rhodocyclaceae bacterium]|nr:hypothetical protein [Rhodocyclaceae bacterium]